MSDVASIAAVAPLPRSIAGRWRLRVHARHRRDELDALLAHGADPWATPALMVRASQLVSLSGRRKLASGMYSLVTVARRRRGSSPFLQIRHRVVLEHRAALTALADRLLRAEPVDVAVVAQLALLLADPSSPVYAGGRDPDVLAAVTSRCLAGVGEHEASD